MNIRVAKSKGVSFSANPILAADLPVWRSKLLLFGLFLAFGGLAARAVWLQIFSNDFLQKQGEVRYARTLELAATRGKILDRDGQVLASSLPVKAIWGVPEEVLAAPPEKLRELASILDFSPADLNAKLSGDKNFIYLRRQVEDERASRIRALRIDGIGTKPEYKRYYPQGAVSAHMVGFTNIEDVGQEGMELARQRSLVGIPGSRRVIRDRLGHTVEDMGTGRDPHDGTDLFLSLDSKVQYIAFKELEKAVSTFQAKAGAVIVVDVHTGEVVALANYPSYDPNQRARLTGSQLRNRAITDTFEPGSILKPFTVALALNSGRYSPHTKIDTGNGRYVINGAPITDTSAHGVIDVAEIIKHSSNIGTSKIALSMPAKEMWEMFTSVGFGQPPQLGFPGAAAGRVRPYKTWRPVEQATMSYGNGISVSLVQLAHAYTMFARDGDVIPLSFTKVSEAPHGRQVISPTTARQMRDMLESVVSPGGTAPKAQVAGYRVGGKTGTAYKVENGRYAMPRKYIASFVGMAPMSAPRFIIAVMIDEPSGVYHYGGQVAAPVFAALAESALRAKNVAPDSPYDSIVIPAQVDESM